MHLFARAALYRKMRHTHRATAALTTTFTQCGVLKFIPALGRPGRRGPLCNPALCFGFGGATHLGFGFARIAGANRGVGQAAGRAGARYGFLGDFGGGFFAL